MKPATYAAPFPAGSLAQRVFGGAAWITAAGGIGRLFSLLTAPILTALVAPSGYGVAALVFAVSSLTATVALAGADASYARHWAGGVGTDALGIERFFWRFAMFSALLSAITATVLWSTSGRLRADARVELAIFVFLIVFLTVTIAMARSRLRFQRRYQRSAISLVVAAGAAAATSVLSAMFWRADERALLVGMTTGLVTELLILGIPVESLFRGRAIPGWRPRARLLEIGLASMASACMYWIITSSDRWFLLWYRDAEELGTYAFASNVGMIGMMLNGAVLYTWTPEITASYEEDVERARPEAGRGWARVVTLLLIAWLAVSSSGGDVIRLLAHPRFHQGASYVPWMAGGVLFYGVASMANTGLWLVKNLRPMAYWWGAGAVASLGMNLLVVPKFGATGAAISACTSFALIAFGTHWAAWRHLPLEAPWGRLALVATGVVGAGIPMTQPWSPEPWVSLSLKFPLGLGIAFLACFLMAPDWMRGIPRRLRAS